MISKLPKMYSLGILMLLSTINAQTTVESRNTKENGYSASSDYATDSYRLMRVPFTQPILVNAAMNDLDRMQSALFNRTLGPVTSLLTNPLSQSLHFLNTLSPFSLDDFINCRFILPSAQSDSNSSSNEYRSEQLSSLVDTNILERLTAPLTALTQRITSPFFNQLLDLVQPRAAQSLNPFSSSLFLDKMYPSVSNMTRCQQMANSPLLGLERGVKFITDAVGDVLQSGFELPITLMSSMMAEQSASFQDFMNAFRNEAINRLQTDTDNLSELIYQLNSQADSTLFNGSNLLSTVIDGTVNTIVDTLDSATMAVLDALDAQPALFAWLVHSVQNSPASPLLRSATPTKHESSDVMQFAIAPFQLGRDITSLSRVHPPLSRLLQYINQPAAAPAFVTLRTLLDEITETGTINGSERFPQIFRPFQQFLSPLNLQLGISNAVLQYLDMILGRM